MNWQHLLQFPKATPVFHSAQWARAELVKRQFEDHIEKLQRYPLHDGC
jgi:hypothetical protein